MANKWRQPLRLDSWDYSQPAAYHITICIAGHTCLLGIPQGSGIDLLPAGAMVENQLLEMPARFPSVGIDRYVVMPNHIHFIIEMNLGVDENTWTDLYQPIQAFKSLTTRQYGIGVREHGWPPYTGILWQKRYFETILRNDRSLERHRQYIMNNPANWWKDPETFHQLSECDSNIVNR